MPRQYALSSSEAHQQFIDASWDVADHIASGSTLQQAQKLVNRAIQAHEAANTEAYLFRVKLHTESAPRIWRDIRVLSDITFHKFHKVLQIAFGWEDCHMYTFTVRDREEDATRPHLQIQDREATLDALDMRDMEVPGMPDYTPEQYLVSNNTKLRRVFGDGNLINRNVEVIYEYDMGDGWEHDITLLNGTAGDLNGLDVQSFELGVGGGQHSFCTAGKGHGIKEDCGGDLGWERLKWQQAERGELDPWHWDIVFVNRRLDHMWMDFNGLVKRRAVKEVYGNKEWLQTHAAEQAEMFKRKRAFANDSEALRAFRKADGDDEDGEDEEDDDGEDESEDIGEDENEAVIEDGSDDENGEGDIDLE